MSDSSLCKSTGMAMDEDDNDCECEDCTASTPPSSMPKPKKRYVPPQPDSDTFSTQQGFLDSLKPTSIEEVDENSRKCPICWKLYGEAADPGFDNTEQPVRLRCNHVFGDKCLANTFGMPEASKFDLHPLSFRFHSRGNALGYKLLAFIEKHGKNFRDDVETFTKMLEESYQPQKGEELFGDYWWSVMRELQRSTRAITNVTFFENAVVMDYRPVEYKEEHLPSYCSIDAESLTALSIDMEQTLYAMTAELGPDTLVLPTGPSSFESLQATTSPDLPMQPSSEFASVTSSTTPPQETIQLTPPPTLEHFTGPSGLQATWEQVLVEQTNLDKLLALQKQAFYPIEGLSDTLAAQEVSIPDQTSIDEAKSRRKRIQDVQERRKRDVTYLLARKLASIFAAFSDQRVDGPHDEDVPERSARVFKTSIVVHTRDTAQTSHEIPSPESTISHLSDGEQSSTNPSKLTWIIARTCCNACCKVKEVDAGDMAALKQLWWRSDAKTPDDCPLCHKVLFKKTPMRSRYSTGMSSDEDFSDDL